MSERKIERQDWSFEDDESILLLEGDKKKQRTCCGCRLRTWLIISCFFIIMILGLLTTAAWYLGYFGDLSGNKTYTPTQNDPPDAPNGLNVTSQGATFLSLIWLPPFNGGATILEYEIQGRLESNNNYTIIINGIQNQEYVVSNLWGNQTYCFQVRARNSVGFGNYSDESCFLTDPPHPPNAPAMIFPLNSTSTSLGLSWTNPTNNGAPIKSYELQQTNLNQKIRENWKTIYQGIQNSVVIKNLGVFQNYSFRVRAQNEAGNGSWCDVAHFHTDSPSATAPNQPQKVNGVGESTQIDVSWNSDTEDNGAIILAYNLEISKGDENFKNVFSGYGFKASIIDLEANQTYCFRLNANNSKGPSPWSEIACIKTQHAEIPNTPTLRLTSTSASSISVEWNEPANNGAIITSYTLQQDDWWTNEPLRNIYVGPHRKFNSSNQLLPSTKYHFRIQAQNNIGPSNWSSVVEFSTNDNGNCGNPSDMEVHKAKYDQMKGKIQSCLIGCALSGVECAIDCISNDLGFSHKCATCWGDMGTCTLKKCAIDCLSPNSSKCKKCTEKECFPNTVVCTGVPMWAFPP